MPIIWSAQTALLAKFQDCHITANLDIVQQRHNTCSEEWIYPQRQPFQMQKIGIWGRREHSPCYNQWAHPFAYIRREFSVGHSFHTLINVRPSLVTDFRLLFWGDEVETGATPKHAYNETSSEMVNEPKTECRKRAILLNKSNWHHIKDITLTAIWRNQYHRGNWLALGTLLT